MFLVHRDVLFLR